MKILHFSTEDTAGGAAKAAYRLHTALRDQGHESRMIVRHKHSQDGDVFQVPATYIPLWKKAARILKHRIPFLKPPTTKYTFNLNVEQDIDLQSALVEHDNVDIICLHWITNFLTVKNIREIYDHFKCPMVLNLMDQEPLTGGCHYSFDCDGYMKQCGNCPQLIPSHPKDRSHITWLEKQRLLQGLPITVIAANSWAAERIANSSLFRHNRVERIGVSIDTKTFRPISRRTARDLLQIPIDKKIIFFGASQLDDPRKGMSYLLEALNQLSAMLDSEAKLGKDSLFLLVAGFNDQCILQKMSFPFKSVGVLQDDITLALAYQSADIFVCPSVEDGGPMMLSESLMCGTPVVAFNSGIAPDLIETGKNGYLASYKDSYDLACGIMHVLLTADAEAMRVYSREKAIAMHDPHLVADRFENLFHSLKVPTN